jgi:hypothetical protein
VFAGKVVNLKNGEWTNNRLVLAFLNSKEVARATTATMEYNATIVRYYINPNEITDPAFEYLNGYKQGITSENKGRLDNNLKIADGLFVLRIPNKYELNLSNLGMPLSEAPFVQILEGNGLDGKNRLAVWIDPFNEGDSREYFIPSKNIRYVVMVLPGDIGQLPAEIQKPGSVALIDGKHLVAINPNAPTPAPQANFSNIKFNQVVETVKAFPPSIFPINNCRGTAAVKQEVTQTYIHEIVDESKVKLGVSIPILSWLQIVAGIERHYGISDKQITTYATTLSVPAGQNIQYTVVRKQTWESGTAVGVNNAIEISAPYNILKNEIFEVANSEQKACP